MIDAATGHLSFPSAPGLGIDLNLDVVKEHPYDSDAYLDCTHVGWEKRLGAARTAAG